MKTPWFMHCHAGTNTGVGVYPTDHGTFVRSHVAGRTEVAWYPMGHEFAKGAGRQVEHVAIEDDTREDSIDEAVRDFMHGRPGLCMVANDGPSAIPFDWNESPGGVVATIEIDGGSFLRIRHGGTVTVEFLPSAIRGNRIEVCRIADACGDDRAKRRADDRIRRFGERRGLALPTALPQAA